MNVTPKHFHVAAAATLLVSSLIACGKAPSAPDFTGFGGGDQKKVENAPSLEGAWTSDCLSNPMVPGGSRRLTMNVSGNSIDTEDHYFSDAQCSRAIAPQTYQSTKGTYTFKSQNADVYVIEYSIPLSSNASQLVYQQVQVKGDTLNVSNIAMDESELTAAPSIAMHHGTAPAPSPTPAPTPAPNATLESGAYTEATGVECPQTVSTEDQEGVLTELFVTFESPCTGVTITFECQGGRCTNDSNGYTITSRSATSYSFDDGRGTYTFTR